MSNLKYAEHKITLLCIGYTVTISDNQVIFEQDQSYDQFTFEWRACIWVLVDIKPSASGIFVPHIAAALEWVAENLPIRWDNGTGTPMQEEDNK